jgi:hypothetical protein
LTVPGVDEKAVILAEIGDVKRFKNGKGLVSWAGLAPSVHDSAGETRTGGITKKGSKWLKAYHGSGGPLCKEGQEFPAWGRSTCRWRLGGVRRLLLLS